MNEVTEKPASRRRFIAIAAALAATIGFAPSTALAITPVLTYDDIPGTGDVKVLNYALALEDLEADLYSQAYARLTEGDRARGIRRLRVSPDALDAEYLGQFSQVEAEHRDLLRGALTAIGGPVIKPFKYDFKINSLNRRALLDFIYTVEATGVGAYLGAIPFFTPNSPYLQIAAAIQGTEARHTAVIAATINELFRRSIPTAPLVGSGTSALSMAGIDEPIAPNDVLAAVSPFIVA